MFSAHHKLSVYLNFNFSIMKSAQQIIDRLNLEPHPEGGYFKETYRSADMVREDCLSSNYSGSRNFSTSIYFLLTPDIFSAFHRINQDEAWHFYDGSPIDLHCISPEGIHEQIIIGKDIGNGQVPQYVVPGGYWFASRVLNNEGWALCGCTVSPGFDFADFELAKRSGLTEQFPQHKAIITELTRI